MLFYKFAGAIILSAVLALLCYGMLIGINGIFGIEPVEAKLDIKTKIKAIGINVASLYFSYMVISALGIHQRIYGLIPSRLNNAYFNSVLFVLFVVPPMLLLSRMILSKCENKSVLAFADEKYMLKVLKFIPTAIVFLAIFVGLSYVTILYLIPISIFVTICGTAFIVIILE